MGQAVIMTQRKCDFILTLMLGLQVRVLLLQNVFSYYRMCSLIMECAVIMTQSKCDFILALMLGLQVHVCERERERERETEMDREGERWRAC
jgi:hypothetical protein